MANRRRNKRNLLQVHREIDVPLKEVSAICLRRSRNHRISLIAVGDRDARLAWVSLPLSKTGPLNWHTVDIDRLRGSKISSSNPQIEAVCADGAGRLLVLQETPPRAELLDLRASRTVASIKLLVEDGAALTRSWSNPEGSRGEGVVLLPRGHLLVAKEKHPAALMEFGPRGSRSRGLKCGGALPDSARWPVPAGEHAFVACAIWLPDKPLMKACTDFSDLAIGPDGRLYVLSDKSETIARIDDLAPGGGIAAMDTAWQLCDLKGKPEGLAFAGDGRAIVALDKSKLRRNLVVLDPPIALPPNRVRQAKRPSR
jgi:hypothetical protein